MGNETQWQTETIYVPFHGRICEIEVPITMQTYTELNISIPQSEPLPSQLEKAAVKVRG